MGVRAIIPGSMTFVVVLHLGQRRSYRVRVELDLQERLVFLPSGILPEVAGAMAALTEQLSEIASNQLAWLKWDGRDGFTEYQTLRIPPGYQLNRSYLRLCCLLEGRSILLPVAELDKGIEIHLEV